MRPDIKHDYALSHIVSKQSDIDQDTFKLYQFLQPVELNPIKETLFTLDSFKKAGDNWDGYNAKKPEERTVENAKLFIQLLPLNFQKSLFSDELSLTPYGTVILDWKARNDNHLSVEIGLNAIGYFSETDDNEDPFSESIDFSGQEVPLEVLEVFEKVFQ